MNQYVMIITLFVIIAACQISGQDQFYGKQEATCLRKGGLCIQKSECEKPVGKEGEFCPLQAAKGFQCCFGLPKSEKRCRMRGGECFKKGYCNKNLVYADASDCSDNQECCILA